MEGRKTLPYPPIVSGAGIQAKLRALHLMLRCNPRGGVTMNKGCPLARRVGVVFEYPAFPLPARPPISFHISPWPWYGSRTPTGIDGVVTGLDFHIICSTEWLRRILKWNHTPSEANLQ